MPEKPTKKLECPVCSGENAVPKIHKKTPEHFNFTDALEFDIFSCPECLAEFAWPRRAMDYKNVSEQFKGYRSFISREDFGGRLDHVLQCTAHWKDSPVVYHLLSLLGFRGAFLDFAAGSGYLTELARRLGYTVSAVEISDPFRRFIADAIPDVSVYGTLEELLNSARKFNVILAMHIIEHFPDPIDVLKRLRSVLAPDGVIIVVVPNLLRAYYRFDEKGKEIEDQIEWDGLVGDFPPHHLTRFRSGTMRIALKRSGFRNVAIGYPPMNVWDLFHDGLGDGEFRFKSYSEDIRKMKLISSFEVRLNEMLSLLGLEDLGNTLVAMASDGMEQKDMESLLGRSKGQVLNTYVQSIKGQYDRSVADEISKDDYIESLKGTIEEKDGFVESLKTTLSEKDAFVKSLRATLEEKDGFVESLKTTLAEKDAYIDSFKDAFAEKDAYIESFQSTVAEKDEYIESLKNTLTEKDKDIEALNRSLAEKTKIIENYLSREARSGSRRGQGF